jgi:hypothetical protein
VKYAVEMGSGALIHIPRFMKIDSGIQKLIGGYAYTKTCRQQGNFIAPLLSAHILEK